MEDESSTASSGRMLYHEVQESKLCAVHCVNTVLQGPFFSEFDLAALASDLYRRERQGMMFSPSGRDFLSQESHNVSLIGDFSFQKALEVWNLQVIPLYSWAAEQAHIVPKQVQAFICHLQDHWFCIRKVNREWYNFDGLYVAPQRLSKFYLAAYLDSLKGFGWSIFLVRGKFPKGCPLSFSESPSTYGQWLSPEDAERIIKSCNPTHLPPEGVGQSKDNAFVDMENENLNAAIAISVKDFSHSPSLPKSDAVPTQD